MRLDELLARLPEGTIDSLSLSDPACDVYNVSFLTDEASSTPHGDVLYFTDSELLPQEIVDTRHFSCVVVDGGPAPETLARQSNVNLVWLTQGANLFACYNALQAVFLEDQEVHGDHPPPARGPLLQPRAAVPHRGGCHRTGQPHRGG